MPIYPEVDPTTGELTPGTARWYVKASQVGVPSGVAEYNASGQVVDAAGVPIVPQTKTTLGLAAARIDVWWDATTGWPARPATTGGVDWRGGPTMPPATGATTGGGGMVPVIDIWHATQAG